MAAPGWIENTPPRDSRLDLHFRELWAYREVALLLALRDLQVRYRQAILGMAWAVLQPLTAALLFAVVLGKLARLPADGVPYLLFAFSGFVLWTYVSNSVVSAADRLVQNRDLVTKVYFPRLLAPVAAVLTPLVELGVSLSAFFVLLPAYGIPPTARLATLPVWIALAALVALGAGVLFAALNAQYRDVRPVLAFLVQLWLFASPVAYASSLVEGNWRFVIALNPLVAIIDGFRWALLATPAPSGLEFAISCSTLAILLIGGLAYFQRIERVVADVI